MLHLSHRSASLPLLGLILLCCVGGCAIAPINTDGSGVAIDGYDPVAYHVDGTPTAGSPEHQLKWEGATWHFASAEHRELFLGNPERYAPQYGGYCAYAVAQGTTAGVDPKQWSIVDDRLFLNYDADIQSEWEANRAEFIVSADQNWPEMIDAGDGGGGE